MFKEGDKISRKDVIKYVADYNDMKKGKSTSDVPIEKNKKVYFDRECRYPRAMFRKFYPDNKITIKPDKADYVIIDKNYNHNIWIDDYSPFYQTTVGGVDWEDVQVVLNTIPKSGSYSDRNLARSHVNLIDSLNKIEKKKEMFNNNVFIDSSTLISDSTSSSSINEEIDDEAKERIKLMLSNRRDRSMVKLGTIMLSQYNFDKNHKEIALMFLSCTGLYLSNTRDGRLFKAKLKEKYPNLKI